MRRTRGKQETAANTHRQRAHHQKSGKRRNPARESAQQGTRLLLVIYEWCWTLWQIALLHNKTNPGRLQSPGIQRQVNLPLHCLSGRSSRMNGPSFPDLKRVNNFLEAGPCDSSSGLWGILNTFRRATSCESIRLSSSLSSSRLPVNSMAVLHSVLWTSITKSCNRRMRLLTPIGNRWLGGNHWLPQYHGHSKFFLRLNVQFAPYE